MATERKLTDDERCNGRFDCPVHPPVPAPPTRTEEPEKGWQPIETAPKSGDWVWMRSERTGRVSAFRWDSSQDATGNHWFAGTGWWPQVDRMFSHWKPMASQPAGPSNDAIRLDVRADAQMLLDALAGPTAEIRRLREQIETYRTWLVVHGYLGDKLKFNELFPPERP